MIALGIIGGLIALIIVSMLFSVRVYIKYSGDFSAKAKYLFFTVFDTRKPPKPKKKKSKSKKKRQLKKARKSQKKAKRQAAKSQKQVLQSGQKESFVSRVAADSGLDEFANDVKKANGRSFDFEMFKLIYDSAKSPVKRLVQRMRFTNVRFNCVVGGDDAAKIALTYGFQTAATSNFLAWVDTIATLKVKEVDIKADFTKEKTDMHMECRVKLRIISAVACLIGYTLNTVRNKNKSPTKSKSIRRKT